MSDPFSAGVWTLLHRGDPCVLCGKPAVEQDPSGCPVTLPALWSRIGDLRDAATVAWETARPGTFDGVKARELEEEAKRLERLHRVLSDDMAPAGGAL